MSRSSRKFLPAGTQFEDLDASSRLIAELNDQLDELWNFKDTTQEALFKFDETTGQPSTVVQSFDGPWTWTRVADLRGLPGPMSAFRNVIELPIHGTDLVAPAPDSIAYRLKAGLRAGVGGVQVKVRLQNVSRGMTLCDLGVWVTAAANTWYPNGWLHSVHTSYNRGAWPSATGSPTASGERIMLQVKRLDSLSTIVRFFTSGHSIIKT